MHDCHKLTIITTTRKCLSVVMSAFIFKHGFTKLQWLGVALVLGSTVAEVYIGKKKKDAAKIANMTADNTKNTINKND